MHDQPRQTVLIIFVPKESNHTLNQNLIYYTKATVRGSLRGIHTPSPDRAALCWPFSALASRPACKPRSTRAETEPTALRQETVSAPADVRSERGTPETGVSPHYSVWKNYRPFYTNCILRPFFHSNKNVNHF